MYDAVNSIDHRFTPFAVSINAAAGASQDAANSCRTSGSGEEEQPSYLSEGLSLLNVAESNQQCGEGSRGA